MKGIAMSDDLVRVEWRLRVMYVLTIAIAGPFGVGNLVAPEWMRSTFSLPAQDPVVFSIASSVYLAFAVVAALGLRAPLVFAPVLLLQLLYKSIWLVGGFLPLLASGAFPDSAWLNLVIFVGFIGGDLWALPFDRLLGRAGATKEEVGALGRGG